MPAKKAADDTKTLVLFMKNGKMRRVTVAKNCRVTFGAVVPGAKNYDANAGWGLRIYDGTKQLAVICGVKEFIEEGAIQIVDRVVTTKRRNIGEDGPAGFKNAVVEARIHRWQDPLAPDEEEEESTALVELATGEADGGSWEF